MSVCMDLFGAGFNRWYPVATRVCASVARRSSQRCATRRTRSVGMRRSPAERTASRAGASSSRRCSAGTRALRVGRRALWPRTYKRWHRARRSRPPGHLCFSRDCRFTHCPVALASLTQPRPCAAERSQRFEQRSREAELVARKAGSGRVSSHLERQFGVLERFSASPKSCPVSSLSLSSCPLSLALPLFCSSSSERTSARDRPPANPHWQLVPPFSSSLGRLVAGGPRCARRA
eukprot:6205890-Pleurochrysis_carterae.AAC.2